MDGLLPRSVLDSIRRTAKSLTGYARRVFQAVIANEHAEGKLRKAESLFGWNRDAVRRGLCEERIGREICSRRNLKQIRSPNPRKYLLASLAIHFARLLPNDCISIRLICLLLEPRRFLKPMQSLATFRRLTYGPRTTPPFCESPSTPKPP